MADKGSDGTGTGDSGYFSRRLPRGTYGSSNYPSYDREDSTLRSRLSDDIRSHSPLRRSDAVTSYTSPTGSRDSSLKRTYSRPYSSLKSEPSVSRTSSTPYRSTRDTYTSPYTPTQDSPKSSSYLRSDPSQYRDENRTRSPYLGDHLGDRSTTTAGYPAYPEGYSSLGRRRVPARKLDEQAMGSTAYERMDPSYIRGTRSVYEPQYHHEGEGTCEPGVYDEGIGGYTSLPYVYELTEAVPVLVESPRMRMYDHPLVDFPVNRRELNRTYSELTPPRTGDDEETYRTSPIMRKRGTYHGGAGHDTRADRIRQRYGGEESLPSRISRDDYPGSLREYRGSGVRSMPQRIREEMSDTLKSNLNDPGILDRDDSCHGILPGVPLPPKKPPPSYQDVLSDAGKRYTHLRQDSKDILASGSKRAETGSELVRSLSRSDELKRQKSDLELRYQNPTGTASKKDFQQTRCGSRDEGCGTPTREAGNRNNFSKSRSSSKGSFDEDPSAARRVRFGGLFDDFERPSLFGRRGRSLFDAFDFNDEREKRRAKFRDMFDDKLSLFGRHRGLFDDWDPFNRSQSGSPQQRSDSGSPKPCSPSPSPDMARSDSPRSSKTTIISESNDPKKGKKVVEITETTSPTTGRKKRKIKETKTSSLDAGDGTKRTVTETKEETIEPNENDEANSAPCEKSWKPIDERNLFDKYRFNFGSFGTFGSGKTAGKETLKFRDFDDLVEKFRNLHQRSQADMQKEEEQKQEKQKDKQKQVPENKQEEEKDEVKEEKKVEELDNKKEDTQNQKVEKDEKNKQIKVEQTNEPDTEKVDNKTAEQVEDNEAEKPCGKILLFTAIMSVTISRIFLRYVPTEESLERLLQILPLATYDYCSRPP